MTAAIPVVTVEVVARDLASYPLTANPRRNTQRASFNDLAGNTTIGILLTAVGTDREGHRHLDEATAVIVAGSGWTEVRQGDDDALTKVEWSAGDTFAVPSNAWHRHYGHPPDIARQLTFKNTPLVRALFGSRAFVRENPFRFEDRYEDRPSWEGATRLADVAALEDRSDLGPGIRAAQLKLAGQRMLETWLVDIPPGEGIRPHSHLVEEAFYVVAGSGRTRLWDRDGTESEVAWSAGDLVSPPAGTRHQHISDGPTSARAFLVRNTFLSLALGAERANWIEPPG